MAKRVNDNNETLFYTVEGRPYKIKTVYAQRALLAGGVPGVGLCNVWVNPDPLTVVGAGMAEFKSGNYLPLQLFAFASDSISAAGISVITTMYSISDTATGAIFRFRNFGAMLKNATGNGVSVDNNSPAIINPKDWTLYAKDFINDNAPARINFGSGGFENLLEAAGQDINQVNAYWFLTACTYAELQ